MPRRKPASGKQRKEELKVKRAIRRGDASAAPATPTGDFRASSRRSSTRGGRAGGSTLSRDDHSVRTNINAKASRRLESSFIKFSPYFLEETKRKASTLFAERPILTEKLLCPVGVDSGNGAKSAGLTQKQDLSLPRRPKWRYDMSKKEVDSNEVAYFKRWLDDTDAIIRTWKEHSSLAQRDSRNSDQSSDERSPISDAEINVRGPETMPYAPPLFERNLEVWRQLWRVVEICQVLLVLLDSRCPPLHYPSSLHAFLSSYRPPRKVIFVLTKVDIVGMKRATLWKKYLEKTYPTIRVVAVESYVEKMNEDTQNRKHVIREPAIPDHLRKDLVEAMKEAHSELCSPPQHISSDPSKLAKWKPGVVPAIDWDAVLNAKDSDISFVQPKPVHETEDTSKYENEYIEDFLSVGLIGQPNVGKSSLLNALFGSHKVKASKTPGKTKHFQTLFWSKQVRLVDCPGLVFPAFVDLELQVLAGVLPISQIPAIPSSIHFALQYLPLERIFGLQHPIEKEREIEDKRTWRVGMQRAKSDNGGKKWAAMDALTAFAESNGWMTAKAGRPDVNRSGNYILRTLAEGRIKWAFCPPDIDISSLHEEDKGIGIWMEGDTDKHIVDDTRDNDGIDSDRSGTDSEEEDDSESDNNESEDYSSYMRSEVPVTTGMFSALSVEDDPE